MADDMDDIGEPLEKRRRVATRSPGGKMQAVKTTRRESVEADSRQGDVIARKSSTARRQAAGSTTRAINAGPYRREMMIRAAS
jgi:hypothetical protein